MQSPRVRAPHIGEGPTATGRPAHPERLQGGHEGGPGERLDRGPGEPEDEVHGHEITPPTQYVWHV